MHCIIYIIREKFRIIRIRARLGVIQRDDGRRTMYFSLLFMHNYCIIIKFVLYYYV